MKKFIFVFGLLLVCFFNNSCETEQINDETGIEDLQEEPTFKIDKEEIEPGPKG